MCDYPPEKYQYYLSEIGNLLKHRAFNLRDNLESVQKDTTAYHLPGTETEST